MGMIFDDVSFEETDEYLNYNALLDANGEYFNMSDNFPSDEELGFDLNEVDDGFILSYGESKEVIPIGTYILIGYVDIKNNPVDYEFAQEYGGFCVFKKIEKDEKGNIRVKQDGGKIVMPLSAYQAASVNTKYNNSILNTITSDDWLDYKSIDRTVTDLQELILESDTNFDTILLRGSTLEDVHANYDLPSGLEAGLNYTFYPFTIAPKRIIAYYDSEDRTLKK